MAAAAPCAPFSLVCQHCEEEIDLNFNTFPKCIHTICCKSPQCLEQSTDRDPDTLICPKCVEGYKMQKLVSHLKRLGVKMSPVTGSGLPSPHPDSSQSARPTEPGAGVQVPPGSGSGLPSPHPDSSQSERNIELEACVTVPPGSGSSLPSPHPDSSQSARPAEPAEAVSSTQGAAARNPSPPTSGTKPCGIPQCKTCPHVINRSVVMGLDGYPIPVIGMHSCSSPSVVVYFRCKVCKKVIVEKTDTKLQQRMTVHRQGSKGKTETKVSKHFKPDEDHDFDRDLEVSVISNIDANRSQEEKDELEKLSGKWVDVGDQTHVT